jgi:ParB-like chromosome segregation protein Spo0J
MANLKITYRPIGALKARPTNPRTHSAKQIEQLAASITHFGFTNPILVDADNAIIAGHGRVDAAKLLGLTKLPTVYLADLSEADNKLAENAGWNRALLGLELQYLSDLDIDVDVTITGFELPEIDILIGELSLDGGSAKRAQMVFTDPPYR